MNARGLTRYALGNSWSGFVRPTVANWRDLDPTQQAALSAGRGRAGNLLYIGRGSQQARLPGSLWASPYGWPPHPRVEAVDMFESDLRADLAAGRLGLAHLIALSGVTLVCWCHPHLCHGDIIAMVAEEAVSASLSGAAQRSSLSRETPSPS